MHQLKCEMCHRNIILIASHKWQAYPEDPGHLYYFLLEPTFLQALDDHFGLPDEVGHACVCCVNQAQFLGGPAAMPLPICTIIGTSDQTTIIIHFLGILVKCVDRKCVFFWENDIILHSTPICPFWAAKCRAVFACKSLALMLILLALSIFAITSVQPFCAAKWMAVFLWLFPLLMFAPASNKSSIISARPFWAAMWRTVFPKSSIH